MDISFLLSLLIATSVHEIGHAIQMKKFGVVIKHISLFGFAPRLFSWHSKYFNCTIGFGWLPIGAYVSHREYSDDLTQENRDAIAMGGVKSNFALAIVPLLLYYILNPENKIGLIWLVLICLGLVLLTTYSVQKFTILYFLPFLLFLLIYLSFKHDTLGKSYEGGFVTSVNLKEKLTLIKFLFNLFFINFFLGIVNMLPVKGLDGWEIFKNGYISKIENTLTYKIVTLALLIWLIVLSLAPLAGDIKKILFFFF